MWVFKNCRIIKAALLISSLKLNNIIFIIDNNNFQSAVKLTDSHATLYPIDKKFKEFGWETANCNGHKTKEIYTKILNRKTNKPFALIAKTIKGYPVSFMKNVPMWHYRSPNNEEYLQATNEINNK